MGFHRYLLAGTAILTSLTSLDPAFAQDTTQLPALQVHDELASSVQRANQLRRNAPNAIIVIEGEQLNQFNDQSVGVLPPQRLTLVSPSVGGNNAADSGPSAPTLIRVIAHRFFSF